MGMAAILSSALVVAPALADSRNVATYGVDLTAEQHAQVQNFFGEGATNAEVIYVNNDQERAYLSAYIPIEQIGDKTYSCALVQPTLSGGIHVKTANLTYVTSDMIAATLATSGVKNCDVVAVCPFKVSGTGALTGVLMAYEQASGQALDTTKKDLANQELITTGSIAQTVGPDLATLIVNDVKANVIQQGVTETTDVDNIVNNVVNNIVNDYSTTVVNNSTTVADNSATNVDNSTTNITVTDPAAGQGGTSGVELSDEEMQALKDFAHALAQQGYSYDDMKETLEMVSKNASQAAGVADPMAPEESAGDASGDAETNASTPAEVEASSGDETLQPEAGDAGTTPDELPQDSILNQTNDVALGADTVVDSTDPSTIGEGVETRQDAEAQQKADDASTVNPDDPFADLTWDETTTGGSGDAPDDSQSNGASTGLETPASDGAVSTDAPDTADAAGNQGDALAGQGGDSAPDESTASASPRPGEVIDDTLGLPQTLTGQGVMLSLERAFAATTLVNGTAEPMLVFEGTDGAAGIMAGDGTVLAEATYAPDGIQGVGNGWILAESPSGMTDVYREAVVPADSSSSAALQLVATVNGAVFQARANGDYLNVQTVDGALVAVDAQGVMADVVPMAVDDFSYIEVFSADAGTDTPESVDGTPSPDVADQPDGSAPSNVDEAAGTFELGDVTEAAVSTDGVTDAQTDAALSTGASETESEVEGAQPADVTVPSALPAGTQEILGTNGVLWMASQPSGKTAVYDVSGAALFTTEFDAVQATANGAWLLVTDATAGESALYRVEVVPGA